MDGKITKQATRLGDVGLVRWGRVVAGQADGIQRAELAARDQATRLPVAGVEAALEAELERDPAAVDVRGEGDRGVEVRGQGLLAERRLAGARATHGSARHGPRSRRR